MPLGADRLSGVFITPILLILTHTKRVFANMYEARKLDKILRSEIRISGKRSASVDVEDIIFTIACSSHHSPPPHSGFTRLIRIRVALGSWAVRLSGCDHIKIHFGKPSRHAFGSLRANSYSHLVRFDSLLTTSSRCLRACTLQAQAVPAARPEDVLAPRESPARVAPSVFAAARSPLALHGRPILYRFVCCWLRLCVPVGTTPSSSCASLFVSLSLRRSRRGSRMVCNQSPAARVDRVVVSPRSQSHRVAITTAPGSTLNDDPRSFSCLSARHLIMAL